MKYLRGYILSQGGRSLLIGRSAGKVKFRPHRRHQTHAGSTEVNRPFCTFNNKFAFPNVKIRTTNSGIRRRVSTTGNGKNQLSVPVALSNIRPSVESFISSVPENSQKLFLKKSQHRKKRSIANESYGKILSDANYLSAGASLPLIFPGDMIGTAFLPTFHDHENPFNNFLPPKFEENAEQGSPGYTCSVVTDTVKKDARSSQDLNRSTDKEDSTFERRSQCTSPEHELRSVQKSVCSPSRSNNPISSLSFDEVHRFGPDKDEDHKPQVFDYPVNDSQNGPFTIHGDRSSVIIHKDLYITNRILDEIKDKSDSPLDENGREKSGEASVRIPLDFDNELDSTMKDPIVESGETKSGKRDPEEQPTAKEDQLGGNRGRPTPNCEQASFSSNAPGTTFEFRNIPVDKLSPAELLACQSRRNLYRMLENIPPSYLLDGVYVKPLDVADGNPSDTIKLPNDIEQQFLDEELLNNSPSTFPELMSLLDASCAGPMRGHQSEKDSDEMQISGELEDWFLPLGREIESMLMDLHKEKNLNPEEADRNHGIDNPIWDPELQNELKEAMNSIGLENICDDHQIVKTLIDAECLPNELSLEIESSLKPSNGNTLKSGQSGNDSNENVPPKKKNPHVEVQTETTIRCSRTGDNTNINVVEIQKYLDKRLPYPFATETVLQVFGTNDALQKATQVVENSKAQLVHLSNATDPNPGMSTPKLQFNHMLSKTHEHTNSKNKKSVLKIRVIPDSPKSSPEIPTPTTPSLTKQMVDPQGQNFTKIDKDTLELMRRSKFGNRSVTSKKARRAESLLKLRTKKKSNEEFGIVKVLSPKELEKLFPSPPKPKPVEVPRKVTISHKPSRGRLNAALLKSNVGSIPLKIQKNGDSWSLKMKPSVKPSESVKIVSSKPGKVDSKNNSDTEGLSTGDRRMLKSIITDKVKDSFDAVARRTIAVKSKELQSGIVPPNFTKTNEKQYKKEQEISKKILTQKLEVKTDPNPNVSESPQSLANKDMKKSETRKNNDPVRLNSPKSAVRQNSQRGTPGENREYITVLPKTQQQEKTAKSETLEVKLDAIQQEAGKTKDDMAVQVSHSSMIASVMKNSEGEPLVKFRLNEPPIEDPLSKKLVKDMPEKRNLSKFGHTEEKDFHSMFGKPKSPQKPKDQKTLVTETAKMSTVSGQALKFSAQNAKNRLDGSLFFPFESPVVKELIDSRSSVPNYPELCEADLCKWNKEKKPSLEEFSPIQCKVPLSKLKQFPILNESKTLQYSVSQSGVVSINPKSDLVAYKKLASVPAVTRVLGATMTATSQQALDRWKQGLISALGEQGFEAFVEKQLKEGTDFHSSVSKHLLGQAAESDEAPCDGCMKSVAHVLPYISDVGIVESQVVHSQLGYRGVVDCVARYKGNPVVIEWKRSDKSKPTIKHTYDAPLQVSAYIGAINYDKNYDVQLKGGIIVVAYSDGSPADVFEVSHEESERYWAKWLRRLHKYYTRL